jgi:bifunctional ADP-heptose synthase (sugar kinase/adenylyltransferase)
MLYPALPIIQKFSQLKVLVLGDLMLDEYIWGTVDRISPEAPVPVVSVTGRTAVPGGAANVAANVAALGAAVDVIGMVGADH